VEKRYVGIDLHRRRSVIVTMDQTGEVLSSVRIENDPVAMSVAVAEAGEGAEVAFEATYGWYWLADLLQADGHVVHMAHPLAMTGMTVNRRVKTDWKDATLLADVMRMGSLPEGWIAPPETRELRELVRYRAKLVALRSGLKGQVHASWPSTECSPLELTCSDPEAPRNWRPWTFHTATRCASAVCEH